MLGRHDVVADVTLKARPPTPAHPRFRRQVIDDIRLGHEVVELTQGQVNWHELERVPVLCLMSQVPKLGWALIVVVEAVNADDLEAIGEERLGEVRADEARAAGYECTHLT